MTRNSHGKALEGGEFEGRETQCPAPQARFLLQKRKLCKTPVEEFPPGFFFFCGGSALAGCRPLHGACALRTHPYTSVHFRTSTLYPRWGFLFGGGSALAGCRPLHGACALRTHPYTSVHFRTSTLYPRRVFLQVTFLVR